MVMSNFFKGNEKNLQDPTSLFLQPQTLPKNLKGPYPEFQLVCNLP
jgi:hypothetical protein